MEKRFENLDKEEAVPNESRLDRNDAIFRQEKEHTCGPTALRMLSALVEGEAFDREKSHEIAPADPERGISAHDFARILSGLEWEYSTGERGSYNELLRLFKEGWNILIQYLPPNEDAGHYAVIWRIDENSIKLWDPHVAFGDPEFTREEFAGMWNGKMLDGTVAWFTAVRGKTGE